MIMTGSIPKSLTRGKTMKSAAKSMSKIMKSDKAADKKMTPAMMKKDISSDKKMLAQKVKAGKGKK